MTDQPTPEQLQEATKIPHIILERAKHLNGVELVRFVYNEAIDDAANFARDLAAHNPEQSLCLKAAGHSIRKWLMIPGDST
jgi:hypothetical protein